jgi:hypothetical protein
MKTLTKSEMEKLRVLYWAFQEAQGALQAATNEIASAHGIDVMKERWTLTPDMKSFVKVP